MIRLCALSFQAQSQGSITLKIIPATQEEDRLKDSKVWGSWRRRGGVGGQRGRRTPVQPLKQSSGKRSSVWSSEQALSRDL